ncbi:MAG: class IV adenylate cyclase [Ktedonobacterales bacterium]
MRNLELKVRCPDGALLGDIAQLAAAAGATPQGVLWQRDTYFHAPRGRLKLREERVEDASLNGVEGAQMADSHAALIGYTRPNLARSRESVYLISPIAAPATLVAALKATLGVRLVVEKRRTLYLLGATRIHLDRVVGLGAFVELETVLYEQVSADALSAEHHRIIQALGLDRLPVIAGSYSDLLEAGTAE